MSDFELDSSGDELADSDIELQEAFAAGLIKPGLNTVHEAPKDTVNNIKGLHAKLNEFKLALPWLETMDCINEQAPLAPELAATLITQEQKRENQRKNNQKLPQISASEDPVLNDFKREMTFHRQAQAAVLFAMPLLKREGIRTIRPDDYFAEMAKTDAHMQKIRESLMKKQEEQKKSERVKQLRHQRKEGKALGIQNKLRRQADKKEMLDQVKKVRKGLSKDLSFLDGKKAAGKGAVGAKGMSRRAIEKRQMKDKKFGFGGKKSGTKGNTKDSAADISEYRRAGGGGGGGKFGGKNKGGSKMGGKRPGKNKRVQSKSKGRK